MTVLTETLRGAPSISARTQSSNASSAPMWASFAPHIHGRRITTVGWLGPREVGLAEAAPNAADAGMPPFWVEVYCHHRGTVLDACGCFDFDDSELEAAVDLVIEAGRNVRHCIH